MRLSNRHSARGAGVRRPVEPPWASAIGRDDYGDWAEISVGRARQRLRLIRPGTFLMGSPEGEAGRLASEGPQHEVTIGAGFWLFDTACTQALWTAVMGKNPSRFKGEDRPVERVSWHDVQDFIAKINDRIPGLNLLLPSEAQWEYACRAGTNTPFSFGEDIAPDQVNYGGDHPYRKGKKGLFRRETVAAGSLPANPWGLYEMHGNLWEWCADGWHDNYDGAPADGSVWESKDEIVYPVVRGGSWLNYAQGVRSASRGRGPPRSEAVIFGFRCARLQDGAEPVAARAVNDQGVEIFPNGAPLVLRGAGARRPVKPAWASAIGRDDYGDWADISVGKALQRLRLIKPGRFLMGSPESEAGRFESEGPQHAVEIRKAFWLFDTACTQALWSAVMGTNPSRFKSADRPVEMVSWDDAQTFIAQINERIPGLNLSLPSEAQWEYACRAGTQGMSYAGDFDILGADNPSGLDAIAWYGANCGEGFDLTDGVDGSGTRCVKLQRANDFGLYDMLGNVDEWCADAWHDDYTGAPADGSVWESKEKDFDRVLRGGSWCYVARGVRSASRLYGPQVSGFDFVGFRCARIGA